MRPIHTFSFVFFVAALLCKPLGVQARQAVSAPATQGTAETHRIVEIVADKDSRFKIAGSSRTPLVLTAGETITLRITAVRAKEADREGSVHGLALLDKKGNRVPGWNLQLKPGTRDYELAAPAVPGEYEAICNVICSADHEHMRMKVTVLPRTQSPKE